MQLKFTGLVENTNLPSSKPLLPLFEAVSNALDAIRATPQTDPVVEITILRASEQLTTDGSPSTEVPIDGFLVRDNGVGFNDHHFRAFNEAFTDNKRAQGGKGIGRVLYLKAFETVEIESTFEIDSELHERSFTFTKEAGVDDVSLSMSVRSHPGTSLTLHGYKAPYFHTCPRRGDTVTRHLVQHFLGEFIQEDCATVVVRDADEVLEANSLRKDYIKEIGRSSIVVSDHELLVQVFSVKGLPNRRHELWLCALNREVSDFSLSRHIPDLPKVLYDETGESFTVLVHVHGPILNSRVDLERTGFRMPSSAPKDSLISEINQGSLVLSAAEEVRKFLDPFLGPMQEQKVKDIQVYVEQSAPQYRPLLDEPGTFDHIPPDLSEDELDQALHQILHRREEELRAEGQALTKAAIETEGDINSHIERYNQWVDDFNKIGKSQLAAYVVRRKAILDVLDRYVRLGPKGQPALEATVHNAIFPIRRESTQVPYEDQNLWILDERLSYHYFLASDKEFSRMSKFSSESISRPDMVVFQHPWFTTDEDSQSPSSITILEFKKPGDPSHMRKKNPIEQVYGYIEEALDGKIIDRNERPLILPKGVRFYCYIICDLTAKLRRQAKMAMFTEFPDRMGYFGFHSDYNAYVEIVSYNKLIEDAKKRNRILFDQLKLPFVTS